MSDAFNISSRQYLSSLKMVSRKKRLSNKRSSRKRSRRLRPHSSRQARPVRCMKKRRQHAGNVDVLPPYESGTMLPNYRTWQAKAPITPPPSYRRPSRSNITEKPLPDLPPAVEKSLPPAPGNDKSIGERLSRTVQKVKNFFQPKVKYRAPSRFLSAEETQLLKQLQNHGTTAEDYFMGHVRPR